MIATYVAIFMYNSLYTVEIPKKSFKTNITLQTRLQELFPKGTKITSIFNVLKKIGYSCHKLDEDKYHKKEERKNFVCTYDRWILYPIFHHYKIIIYTDNKDLLSKLSVKE
ncbi:MAG: hypothetical protein AB8U16_01970 [Rickettsiales endosymbiont of Dermacentor nuttalli]